MAKSFTEISAHYFNRFPDFGITISESLPKNIRTIIVIPCFKEPEILSTLKSLASCKTPKNETLVLVLINASENAEDDTKKFNLESYNLVQKFIDENTFNKLSFKVFLNNQLPAKHAGVGYARKILMDTALKIFEKQKKDGIIVNTDADCLFSANYIQSIENTFENKQIALAVMHYEHRIEQEENALIAKGITEYELHLRYYKQALSWTTYPNVLETIGSCMVCKAGTYALEGGMNKRKAAEDFYFINKLAKNHISTTITSAKVMPSCRTSDRVPFGTGKAMNDYLNNQTNTFQSYDFACFKALKIFIDQIEDLFQNEIENLNLEYTTILFFNQQNLKLHLEKIRKQSKNKNQFKKHFLIGSII